MEGLALRYLGSGARLRVTVPNPASIDLKDKKSDVQICAPLLVFVEEAFFIFNGFFRT